MILQPITPKLPPNWHQKNNNHLYSITAASSSSGLLRNSTFFLKQPIISTRCKNHRSPAFITCSSISRVHSYGTVDYEKNHVQHWKGICKQICTMKDPSMGAASVLNQVENKGRTISKWVLCRIVKELRKFGRYKFALEVYEWMNNRPERYRITTSDTAIQLDLIAKVHGISSAEQYFFKLPDGVEDKRICGSLLNVYARARMREKAESLMDKIRDRGYASHALPFNVMMTLYTNLKDHKMIEPLISEMKEKNIGLDLYTYNIWLASCGAQESLEKMEQVFEQMQLDPTVKPNWSTFGTMAALYIKLGHIEKAEDCLRKIERRLSSQNRMPYHFLISLYGSAGNKEDVYRAWNLYKATFVNIPNFGYHSVISALVRLDDTEGAEKIYDEWLSVKSLYDPRVGNLLLASYVQKGLSHKAKIFFDQMIESGGKPNSVTWEILAEDHICNTRMSEALSCLQNAAYVNSSKIWKPKLSNVNSILKLSEQEGDTTIKDTLLDVLRQVGCLDDVSYMSFVSIPGGGTHTGSVPAVEDPADSDDDNNVADLLLNQVRESL